MMELYLEGTEPDRGAADRGHPARDHRRRDHPGAVRHRVQEQGRPAACSTRSWTTCPARSTSRPSRATRSATRSTVVERHADADEPFSALAFKIMRDQHLGKLTYIRVYSGTLESGSTVLNSIKGRRERIGKIYQMHANKREERPFAVAGQIVAVMGLKDTTTGDTLCDAEPAGDPGVDDLPGAGHQRGHRAEDQGRPGEAGHRDPAARRGGPDLPGPDRRGDRPDDHLRHGRAAPGGAGRPDEAASSRSRPTSAARRSPTARPSAARWRRSSTRTRSRPVAPASTAAVLINLEPTGGDGGGYEFENKVTGGRIPQGVHPLGGRRAARRPPSSACWPATRWSTSR